MISRRHLLYGGLGIIGLTALRLGLTRPEDAIEIVLRKRLDYLVLEPAGVAAFATDFTAAGVMARGKLRLIAAMAPLYGWLPADETTPNAVRHGEERIVSAYLLSSDFFSSGADTQRPVNYRGLFNPWKSRDACNNTFARREAEAI